MYVRIGLIFLFAILMTPLIRPLANPILEKERKTLLRLIEITSALALLLGLLRRLNWLS